MTATRQSRDSYHKKSYRRSWLSASPLTKLQLALTTVVALATVIYAGFSGWQLLVIRSGGEDTRKLADAAQRQADATSQQANAMRGQLSSMQDQANSMKAQTNTLDQSLAETRKAANAAQTQANASLSQAGASRKSAEAAERSASIAQIGLLPRIVATLNSVTFESDKQIKVVVDVVNKGGTTAANCISQLHVLRFERPLPPGAWHPRLGGAPSVSELAPQASTRQTVESVDMTPEEFRDITEGRIQLRFWVWGSYDTEFGRRAEPFAFCFTYSTQYRQFGNCSREEYEESKPN